MVSGCAARASGGRPAAELDAALEIFEKYARRRGRMRLVVNCGPREAVLRSRPQAGWS